MPISRSDMLFSLIKSLSRGEKRHFRSFAQREAGDGVLLYLQLFDVLEKQKLLNEQQLSTRFAKGQLPNLKRHLYSQIMVSLRLQQQKDNSLIQLREYLDFANILYGKGLYLQSLKLIDKAKNLAAKLHDELIMLQLLEFEKIIESRHITRTGAERVTELTEETVELLTNVQNRLLNSNLRLQLHGYYIRHGHVQSLEQAQEVRRAYKDELDTVNEHSLGLVERAYYYQSRVWYHFILLEFGQCLECAILWVDLFKLEGKYMHRDSNLMMRAYHYILTCLYHLGDVATYVKYLDEFELFREVNYKKFNKNSQIISFIYVHNGRLNKYVLTKNYTAGVAIIPKTLVRLKRYADMLDSHRVLVLHYKISLLYIMAAQPEHAIKYLHGIMNTTINNLREDIQGYARIAFLMAHYDMENFDVVQSQIRNIKSYFSKSDISSELNTRLLQFFTQVISATESDRAALITELAIDLNSMNESDFERRGMLYLNIIEWVQQKKASF